MASLIIYAQSTPYRIIFKELLKGISRGKIFCRGKPRSQMLKPASVSWLKPVNSQIFRGGFTSLANAWIQ